MRFYTTIEGLEAWITVPDTGGTYEVLLPDFRDARETAQRFPSVEAAAAAIKAHDQGFDNPTAYYMDGGDSVREVTVTSVSAGGKEAWIRREVGNDVGRREKVSIERLFTSEQEVEGIIRRKQEALADIAEKWRAAERWQARFANRTEG